MTARKAAASRHCIACGGVFLTARLRQFYCGKICADIARTIKNKHRRRLIAPAKKCAVCGDLFRPSFARRRAVTCSTACGAANKKKRRALYLERYKIEAREVIRAGNARYYRKNREAFAARVAEATAAACIVRGIIRDGIASIFSAEGETLPKCAFCGVAFRPKYKTKLCGRAECHSGWAQLAAQKRWHGKPMPSVVVSRISQPVRDADATEKRRAYNREWKQRNRDRARDRQANRQCYVRRTAALNIVRKLINEGPEALL